MDAMHETLQSVSMKVSRVLDFFCSRELLSKSKDVSILKDLIENILTGDVTITAGSIAEGTFTPGSDSDTVFVISEVCAIKDTESIPPSIGHISCFQTKLESARPGFCMLRLLKLEDLTRLHAIKHVNVTFSDCLVTCEKQKYLSSEKFGKMMAHIHKMNSPGTKRGSDVYRNGPCATTDFNQPIFTKFTRDLAFAIPCHSWPDASIQWLHRPRRNEWPSNELIETIRKLPCHLVCIGDQESPNFDLEWRFAFVYQELQLVWNFSSVQIQCYYLLKALKRAFISPFFPDKISSYHLKTTMLWLIEQTPSDLWKEENLLQCILICLDRLKEFIRAGNLPHFFLKERNLVYNKLKTETEKQRLLSVLAHIQDNIVKSVNGALTSFLQLISGIRLSDFVMNTLEVLFQIRCRHNTFNLFNNYTVICLDELYARLSIFIAPLNARLNLDKILETLDLDERILRGVKSFNRIRIALQTCNLSQLQMDQCTKMKMLDNANNDLKASCALDGMSGRLYYATLALLRGDLLSAKARIMSLLKTNKRIMFIESHNQRYQEIVVQDGKLIQRNVIPTDFDMSHNDSVTFNVYFVLTDMVCLPEALQYECALLGERNRNPPYCSIHPVVYAYFLLTTVSLRERNINKVNHYLDLLDDAVEKTGAGLFKHVALNLLGYSYYKAGKPYKAFNVFCRSFQNYNACNNAALYHLCILILDLLSTRTGN